MYIYIIFYLFDLRLDVFHIYFSSRSSRDQEKRITSSCIDGWRLHSPPQQYACQREDGREISDLDHVNRQARGLMRSNDPSQSKCVFDYNAPFLSFSCYDFLWKYIYTSYVAL